MSSLRAHFRSRCCIVAHLMNKPLFNSFELITKPSEFNRTRIAPFTFEPHKHADATRKRSYESNESF